MRSGSADLSARDYTRRLYRHVEEWYENADSKAQVLLTLNGLFLGVLGSAAFVGGEDTSAAVGGFGFESFVFFLLFLGCLGASVTCALLCLKSRLHLDRHRGPQPPNLENLWFFQEMSAVAPRGLLQELHRVDPGREIEILGRNVQTFARNVVEKHLWFNRGLKFFVSGLISFSVFTACFVVRLSMTNPPLFSPWLFFTGLLVIVLFELAYWGLDRREDRRTTQFHASVVEQLSEPDRS